MKYIIDFSFLIETCADALSFQIAENFVFDIYWFLSYFCFESKIWLSLLQDSKDIRNIFIQNPDSNFPFPVEKQLLSFQTFVRKFDSAAFLDPPGFPGFLFFQCFQCLPFSHHLSTPLSESFSVPDKKKKFPFHFIPVISLVRGGLEGRWVT